MATIRGFIWAGILVLSVAEGGMIWFAPQCSTWLNFISAVCMCRKESNNFVGNTNRKDVREANACARCISYLISVCAARGVVDRREPDVLALCTVSHRSVRA
eukprot:2851207-Pyramimonas_sp.AAC.1